MGEEVVVLSIVCVIGDYDNIIYARVKVSYVLVRKAKRIKGNGQGNFSKV